MIESVYNSKAHGNTSSVLVKIPKNVRQVGQVNDAKKIYVEDYVMSYIKKLGMRKDASSELVVLLGQFVRINECQCIFISGAIEIKSVIYEDNLVFSNEIWTNIYETIKKYFTNVEIVGWSIIRAGLPLNVDERIRKVHVDNFAGQDKTLLLYDSLEREEAFYVFEENRLKRQDGYYIFYDKNAEMQDYIITLREEEDSQKPYSIPHHAVVRNTPKAEEQPVVEKRKKPGFLYGLGTVAAVIVLVFSASRLNSYENKNKQKDMKDALSGNVVHENSNGKGNKKPGATEPVTLPVETAHGQLKTVNNDEELSKTATPSVEPKKSAAVKGANKPNSDNKAVSKDGKESDTKKETDDKKADEASTTKSYYTVKKGDSLTSIAEKLYDDRKYVKKIMELNDIEDSDMIKTGQKLLLP